MARSNFRVEQGIEIHDANGTGDSWVLRGSGAPVGTSGATADAPVGSLYMDGGTDGNLYRKTVDNNLAADWVRFVDDSVYTTLGIAFDDEDMGTYSGGILTDNEDTKTNIQELSNAIEAIAGGSVSTTNVPAATPTTISTCLVDDCNFVEWEVFVYDQGTEALKEAFKISAIHDGKTTADATTFDESTHTKLKLADVAGLTFTTKLTGAGTSQTIGLEISATAAITVVARRTSLPL